MLNFTQAQLQAAAKILQELHNASQNRLLPISVNNHDPALFCDEQDNLYIRFLSTLGKADGAETTIYYLLINAAGEKEVLNKKYDEVYLATLFRKLQPASL